MNPKFSATYSFSTAPSGNLFVALAWRNLWRNKKRTLISIASIFFAVFLAVIMSAMQSGQHEYMVESAVSMYTGHIQVHGLNYWDKRSLDQSLLLTEREKTVLDSLENSMVVTYRLETFSLVSHDLVTKVTPVVGINPDREDKLTGLRHRVVAGTYLSPEAPGAMLAEGLAKMLNVTINDSVVLYGQGFQGVTAAVIVPVTGIVRFPIPDINNAMTYLSLRNAQQIYCADGRLTSATILVGKTGMISSVTSVLRSSMNSDKEVMTWEEMMPELVQAIAADNGGTVIMLLILYVVIGFGIFGTVMMMTVERSREFGIIIAVGMKKSKLIAVTVVETIIISLLGALSGILASFPFVLYFAANPIRLGGEYAKAMLAYGFEPILSISSDPMIFLIQGAVVFLLGMISASYPLFVIRSLLPVKAMRG